MLTVTIIIFRTRISKANDIFVSAPSLRDEPGNMFLNDQRFRSCQELRITAAVKI